MILTDSQNCDPRILDPVEHLLKSINWAELCQAQDKFGWIVLGKKLCSIWTKMLFEEKKLSKQNCFENQLKKKLSKTI